MTSENETTLAIGNQTEEPRSLKVEGNNLVELIFLYSVIIAGILGTLANGIVIMMFLKQSNGTKMSTSNKLILNQMTIDLISCMSLILVYGWKAGNVKSNRSWSYLSCCLIESETLIRSPVIGSSMNLIFLTLERYWNIVHNSLYREYYRNWIAVMVISLAWIIGYGLAVPVTIATVDFSDGICRLMNSPSALEILNFNNNMVFVVGYGIPVLVFVVCYSHILVIMKASSKNFDNPEGGEANPNVRNMHYRRQMTLAKTMMIIIVSFVVCWAPNNVVGVLMTAYPQSFAWAMNSSLWYGTLFAGLLEACIHPFIYGARVDLVRNYMKEILSKYRSGTCPTDPNEAVTGTRFWMETTRNSIARLSCGNIELARCLWAVWRKACHV